MQEDHDQSSLRVPAVDAAALAAIEDVATLEAMAALLGDLVDDLGEDPESRLALTAHAAIARIGRALRAERTMLIAVDRRGAAGVVLAAWSVGGAGPVPRWLGRRVAEVVPLAELAPSVADLVRNDASPDQPPLVVVDGSNPVVAVPVRAGKRTIGLLLLVHPQGDPHAWSEANVGLVRTAAGMILGTWELLRLSRRPGLDERSGLADRRLLLVELGRMLRRLAAGRSTGVAVVVVQLSERAPTAAQHRVGLLQVGALLEERFGDTDLVALFDSRMLVVGCDGMASAQAAMERAKEMAALLSGEEVNCPRVVSGVAFTATPVAAGVLLRRADAATHRASALGRTVVLSAE